jgi:hypothetical protein
LFGEEAGAMGYLMHSNVSISEIEEVVADTLRDDFDNIKILNVKVFRDEDSDGDEILRIDVVFEGSRKDARTLAGAVRHVRPKLSAIGEKAFPLFSFISERDAGAGMLEPA